jgi:biopolymer transport protein TolR
MRRRIHEEEHAGELNIVPYLDIVTNLVMFMLLSMTGLVAFGVVNVSAPRIGGEGAGAGGENTPRLLLTVAISQQGFYVAGSGGVLGGAADQAAVDRKQPPTVPLKADGRHDYAALTEQMLRIKDRYPAETNLILSADEDIPYDILVQTMDACREAKVPKGDGTSERKPLFFDVSLSLIG